MKTLFCDTSIHPCSSLEHLYFLNSTYEEISCLFSLFTKENQKAISTCMPNLKSLMISQEVNQTYQDNIEVNMDIINPADSDYESYTISIFLVSDLDINQFDVNISGPLKICHGFVLNRRGEFSLCKVTQITLPSKINYIDHVKDISSDLEDFFQTLRSQRDYIHYTPGSLVVIIPSQYLVNI